VQVAHYKMLSRFGEVFAVCKLETLDGLAVRVRVHNYEASVFLAQKFDCVAPVFASSDDYIRAFFPLALGALARPSNWVVLSFPEKFLKRRYYSARSRVMMFETPLSLRMDEVIISLSLSVEFAFTLRAKSYTL